MNRVRKLSHAVYETPDLVEQTDYFTDVIGLVKAQNGKDEVFLSGTVDHHSAVLRRGGRAACTAIGLQIGPDEDLGAFERHVRAHGVTTSRRSDAQPTISDMLVFQDPKGTTIEVFAPPTPQVPPTERKGIVPSKLGHVAFHVADVQTVTKFYCDVLGFRVSDWIGDTFSFLRCGPDHHSINLMETGEDRHFHSAFELKDWSHIHQACDVLSRSGYRLLWGPGRHGAGHNVFTYHRSPNGLITELFTELDQMLDEDLGYFDPRPWHTDSPQRPKVWPKGPDAANLWGNPPPPEMLKS